MNQVSLPRSDTQDNAWRRRRNGCDGWRMSITTSNDPVVVLRRSLSYCQRLNLTFDDALRDSLLVVCDDFGERTTEALRSDLSRQLDYWRAAYNRDDDHTSRLTTVLIEPDQENGRRIDTRYIC